MGYKEGKFPKKIKSSWRKSKKKKIPPAMQYV